MEATLPACNLHPCKTCRCRNDLRADHLTLYGIYEAQGDHGKSKAADRALSRGRSVPSSEGTTNKTYHKCRFVSVAVLNYAAWLVFALRLLLILDATPASAVPSRNRVLGSEIARMGFERRLAE